jgi:hypothetical protein
MSEARVRAAMERLEALGFARADREELLANRRRLKFWSLKLDGGSGFGNGAAP